MTDLSQSHDSTLLPLGYRQIREIDLKKARKLAAAIQMIFVFVVVVAVVIPLVLGVELDTQLSPLLTIPVTLIAALLYMAVHEATHGVVLQLLTGVRPTYRVRFPFLSTGNQAFLTRRNAVIVALAPAVVWGVVLVAALLLVPADFRLTGYIVLALNFAGSGGDFVEAFVAARQPREALVQDDGKTIRVYVPEVTE